MGWGTVRGLLRVRERLGADGGRAPLHPEVEQAAAFGARVQGHHRHLGCIVAAQLSHRTLLGHLEESACPGGRDRKGCLQTEGGRVHGALLQHRQSSAVQFSLTRPAGSGSVSASSVSSSPVSNRCSSTVKS
jgi:hypothetical protein